LLRGIAWAGGQPNVDVLCRPDELNSLAYPVGGPTAPERAHEKLVLHPDFTVNLVAAEPLIEKPISLDWDPQGRLWVAETPEYPGGRTVNPNDASIARGTNATVVKDGQEQRPARDRISW